MIGLTTGSDNWVPIWQLPIVQSADVFPRQYCPLVIQSPVVLLKLELLGGFHSHRLGGYLNQHIDTGTLGTGSRGARVGVGKKIFVDELQIIIFEIAATSVLSFDLLTRVASNGLLTVFEYDGIIVNG